jgi:16S rRNA (adenine1518-N6/adenine1519-N6)-dimethyltransferase
VVSRFPPIPNRELGQHFLVDENILRVIERLAELDPDDVVLEVGAGLGVLTTFLAERVAAVVAIEIDRELEPHLRARLAGYDNVRLRIEDALHLEPASLEPPPTKLVANLPYAIATPLLVESLDRLPSLVLWCVMVQREVADRLLAAPATRAYGAVSVLVQLTAERAGFHPVSRSCFYPPPNVDSALVALRRTRSWDDGYRKLKLVVQGAFAHRRKTLVNSLVLAGVAGREASLNAVRALGLPEDVRAEALPPPVFVDLAAALA